jgi:hypothetical protein
MIGCYDFCGHYEWTFDWLEREGGIELVREYWKVAISEDSQKHARDLIVPEGIEGMKKYWQHTLEEEAAGFAFTSDEKRFRIDMHDCPSKGFLIRNDLEQYGDYCDHCIGWIGPVMRDAGYVIDHEHNHKGKCWWEFRAADNLEPPSAIGEFAEDRDVRAAADWQSRQRDRFRRATSDEEKSDSED